jgi:hypothetical protein
MYGSCCWVLGTTDATCCETGTGGEPLPIPKASRDKAAALGGGGVAWAADALANVRNSPRAAAILTPVVAAVSILRDNMQ